MITPCRDYRPNELLDAYEEEGIDEVDEADITMEERLAARRQADRELNKRDRRENRGGFPGALNGKSHPAISAILNAISCGMVTESRGAYAESDSDDSDHRPARRRRVEAAQADDASEGQVCRCGAQHAT